MSGSVFVLYFDPAEVDPLSDEPAYLKGVFATHDRADAAREALGPVGDPRWTVVEEAVDEVGWLGGFVTMRTSADEGQDDEAE